jgi:hypothetical protein
MIQSIEFLYPNRAISMWGQLEPLLGKEGNDCATEDILRELKSGLCGVFAYYEDKKLKLAFTLRFTEVGKEKHAEIFALGGEGLMRFRKAYWNYILMWLKANQVKRLEVYGNERMVRIYRAKFGFNQRHEYASMAL